MLRFIAIASIAFGLSAEPTLHNPYKNESYTSAKKKLHAEYVASLTSADRDFLEENRKEYAKKFAELEAFPVDERAQKAKSLKMTQYKEIVQGLSPQASFRYIMMQKG